MSRTNNYFLYILNMAYSASMIFSAIMPKSLVALISLAIFIYNFTTIKKHTDTVTSLLVNSILFLPVSFISILGTDYGKLPITWHSISILLLIIIVIKKKNINKNYAILYSLFTLFFLISLSTSSTIISALSQFFTISLCLFAFQIGEFVRKTQAKEKINLLIDFYLLSTIAFSFQVIIQRIWIMNTGQVIGHFAIMGGRSAYSGLMGDYSFASLYLATGALLLVMLYLTKKKTLAKIIVPLILLIMTSILISARTGIFSLALVLLPTIIYFLRKNTTKAILLCLIGAIIIPIAINYMLSVRNTGSFFGDSGRLELISTAWDTFSEHPLFGIGFGIENIKNNYNMIVPHNFFVQYLLQFGLIGFCLLLPNFIYFYIINRKDNYIMWMFVLCMIGSMLIPDIVSSRFLAIIIILATINRK